MYPFIIGRISLYMAIQASLLAYSDKTQKRSKAFKKFTTGIANLHTKSDYVSYLLNFFELNGISEQYEKAAKCSPAKIDEMLEKFIDDAKEKGNRSSTIRTKLAGVELFFIMNDCIWHKDRIRRSIKKDVSLSGGDKPISNEDIQSLLDATKSLRNKAIIHFLASTGARTGAIADPPLQFKHLTKMQIPDNTVEGRYCYAIEIYSGTRDRYWAFLTPEAAKALDRYINSRRQSGEDITPDSILFKVNKTKTTSVKHVTTKNLTHTMMNLHARAGISREKTSENRYDMPVIYGFRKRFNTILKLESDVNSNIAEKLMAHKNGLDGAYLQPTREECFAEFLKAIGVLTIDPTERQKITIHDQQAKITKLQIQEAKIRELELKNIELENSKKLESMKMDTNNLRIEQIIKSHGNEVAELQKQINEIISKIK